MHGLIGLGTKFIPAPRLRQKENASIYLHCVQQGRDRLISLHNGMS